MDADGLDRELAMSVIDDWGVRDALDADDRAYLEDPNAVMDALRSYLQDASFALLWACGLADEMPMYRGDERAFERATVDLNEIVIQAHDPTALVARAALRPLDAILDELDYYARYAAAYATVKDEVWLGPLAKLAVKQRLMALRWLVREG